MEDLDTLRLLAKVIPETCNGHTEEDVMNNVFELTFAIDEVVSIGYRENVTLEQINDFCEMDSHEEKLQKIILEVRCAGRFAYAPPLYILSSVQTIMYVCSYLIRHVYIHRVKLMRPRKK